MQEDPTRPHCGQCADCGGHVPQDFRALLVKLMVDANDDPQSQAYKQIEQLVEAQVPYP
jgi:hypothetical protein